MNLKIRIQDKQMAMLIQFEHEATEYIKHHTFESADVLYDKLVKETALLTEHVNDKKRNVIDNTKLQELCDNISTLCKEHEKALNRVEYKKSETRFNDLRKMVYNRIFTPNQIKYLLQVHDYTPDLDYVHGNKWRATLALIIQKRISIKEYTEWKTKYQCLNIILKDNIYIDKCYLLENDDDCRIVKVERDIEPMQVTEDELLDIVKMFQ